MSSSLLGGNQQAQQPNGLMQLAKISQFQNMLKGIQNGQGVAQSAMNSGVLGPTGKLTNIAMQNPNGLGAGIGQMLGNGFSNLLGGAGGAGAGTAATGASGPAAAAGAAAAGAGGAGAGAGAAGAAGGLGGILSTLMALL